MNRIINNIRRWMSDTTLAMSHEFGVVRHDMGVMIFFLALPLLYPIVYTLIYNPEVVNKVPVAVVDDSRTAASRELIRRADAAPQIDIYDIVPNMADAKRLWADQKVYAIMHIPADYARDIARNEQARVQLYCDMSLLIRYRSLLSATSNLQLALASDITAQRIDAMGAGASGMVSLPINSDSHFLGDTQQGFASFVIPGIVVLILQQSMLLGIGMIGGTARERRRTPVTATRYMPSAAVWGKALCYVVIYIPMAIYILHYIPVMFHLPHYGSPIQYLLFIFPMLLATAFLGQALTAVMRQREYVFLLLVFTSVIFLFLSGLTWPRYAMSPVWRFVGDLVPATWGVEGFIRINSNSATIADNSRAYLSLWALTAIYYIAALIVTRVQCSRSVAESDLTPSHV